MGDDMDMLLTNWVGTEQGKAGVRTRPLFLKGEKYIDPNWEPIGEPDYEYDELDLIERRIKARQQAWEDRQ